MELQFPEGAAVGLVMQAAYIGRRGERLFMAYDANQVNPDSIIPSFLVMQQNRAKGCAPAGTGCPAGVTGVTPALLGQPSDPGGLSATAAASFLNSSTTTSELDINGAGQFRPSHRRQHARAEIAAESTVRLDYHDRQSRRLELPRGPVHFAAQIHEWFGNGSGVYLRQVDRQSVGRSGGRVVGRRSVDHELQDLQPDIRNFRDERGRSDFDRTHVLTASTVWELPFGKGKHYLSNSSGVMNQIFGGWTANAIYTFQSGEPFAVRSGAFTSMEVTSRARACRSLLMRNCSI
jgi:hypothetical protein